MNSYNENLHSSIVTSLDEQRLELQKSKSSLDASKFSLYYAQGDKITAAEKLSVDNDKYKVQTKVYDEAVKNSNFSTNVVAVANSGKDHVSTSVSNTAVASANVQIATNAIVKLASDMGAINTIIAAADYNTDIYSLSTKANNYMGATAYLAEKTSQYSMEASAQIAAVSSNSLADIATATDGAIKKLLDASKTDFETITATVNADNEELAAANTVEKAAEGILADSDVNYNATKSAYAMNNNVLNLNLKVTLGPTLLSILSPILGPGPVIEPTNSPQVTSTDPNKTDGDGTDPTPTPPYYSVSFSQYTAPDFNDIPAGEEPITHPVENYYVLLVDYNRSSNFNISDAEAIVSTNPIPKDSDDDGDDEGIDNKFYYAVNMDTYKNNDNPVRIDDLEITSLLDDQGKKMNLGDKYVVFVYAVFSNDYKKAINTYDDYLSAPSMFFSLTEKIEAPKGKDIEVLTDGQSQEIAIDDTVGIVFDSSNLELQPSAKDKKIRYSFDGAKETTVVSSETKDKVDPIVVNSYSDSKQVVVFPVDTLTQNDQPLEYRCMFLPYNSSITKGCMTSTELKYLEVSTILLEEIVEQFTLKEEEVQSQKTTLITAKNSAESDKGQLDEELKDETLSDSKKKKKEAERKKLVAEIDSITTDIAACNTLLKQLSDQKEAKLKQFSPVMGEKPGFYFDMTIATKVSPANYTVAKILTVEDEHEGKKTEYIYAVAEIEESTTDNFGNRLLNMHQYIPVILVLPQAGTSAVTKEFTNALSMIKTTDIFTYRD